MLPKDVLMGQFCLLGRRRRLFVFLSTERNGEMNDYSKAIMQNKKNGMRYPHILLEDGKVIKLSESTEEDGSKSYRRTVICRSIRIIEIKSDIYTKDKMCVLEYVDDSGKTDTKEVFRNIISDSKKVVELSRYGLDITSENAADVVRHFRNETSRAKSTEVVTKAGILPWKEQFMFVGEQCFYRDKESEKFKRSRLKYEGKLDIRKSGTYEAYKAMLDAEVIPSVHLSTALVIGASSLLVGYIGGDVNIPNILAHLSGDSSTGKSTALQLAVSIYGGVSCSNGKNSLFASWNSTDNALQEMMAGNNGIAIGLDELGMKQTKNFASMIYRLAEGKEKQRMKFGEGNQEVREWHTTIISTGELPMEDDTDQATGQKVRLLYFESIPWTDNAGHSERIKNVLLYHYGLLGERLAKRLLSHPKEFWVKKHAKEIPLIADRLECGKLNNRIANSLALIMVSAKMLYCSGIQIDLDSIRDFLIATANATRGAASSIGERAYEKFKAEINSNQNNIELRKRNGSVLRGVPCGELWGTALPKDDNSSMSDWEYVNVPTSTVDAFLKENGFHNPTVIYNEWARKGYILLAGKKLYHKIKIGNINNMKCMRFLL